MGFEFLDVEYKGCTVKHNFKCLKHDFYQSCCFRQINQGNGLKCCGTAKLGGSKHYNWNPNLSEAERRNRRSNNSATIKWVKLVRKRDNYNCQVCFKSKQNDCIAHHLESYDVNASLRYEVSNGIVLCRRCHNDFHQTYGYGNNTTSQFNDFKGAKIGTP